MKRNKHPTQLLESLISGFRAESVEIKLRATIMVSLAARAARFVTFLYVSNLYKLSSRDSLDGLFRDHLSTSVLEMKNV